MAEESERKFLVAGDGWRAGAARGAEIRQFYVASGSDRTVRVRIRDGRSAKLTLKFGGAARVRDEYEYELPVEDARELERFALGNVIEKVRSIVRHRDHDYEIDEFAGALSGLVVAELETADEVPDAALPAWLGREVTGDGAYYNAALALNGIPGKAA